MIPECCSDGDLLAYEELRSSVACDRDAVGSCLGFQSLVISVLSETGTSGSEDSLCLGACKHNDKQMIEQELGKKETEVQYEREGSNVLFGKVREV